MGRPEWPAFSLYILPAFRTEREQQMSNKPNAYGFEAKGKNCDVRVYEDGGILTYRLYRDGETLGGLQRAEDNEAEPQLVKRIIGMMGGYLADQQAKDIC
jgi:hypothetical protein